jgi:5-formyltetrahydrofolate cyclo-ligase
MKKSDLRKTSGQIRDGISTLEKIRLDKAIMKHLLSWEKYCSSTHLFCYVSFRSEVNTKPIIEASLEKGKTVAVPRIDMNSGEMRAYIIEDTGPSLEPGIYGILEPVGYCIELDYQHLELIIAPGLAFTPQGQRLGYGGGFYDRFMERHAHATLCALVYDRLILDQIPVKGHDIPVDYLVTESGVHSAKRENL